MKKLILSRLTMVCAVLTLNIITSTDLVACDRNITLDQGLCHTFANSTVALIDVAKVCVAAGFSAVTYTASALTEQRRRLRVFWAIHGQGRKL